MLQETEQSNNVVNIVRASKSELRKMFGEQAAPLGRANGFFLAGEVDEQIAMEIALQRKPFVVYGWAADQNDEHLGSRCIQLREDMAYGQRMAAEYLIRLGHRRLGVLLPSRHAGCLERQQGFLEAIRAAGLEESEQTVQFISNTTSSEVGRETLKAGVAGFLGKRDRYTAILSPITDTLPLACMKEGIVLGRELSLVCDCGGIDKMLEELEVSEIKVDFKAMGKLGAAELFRQLSAGNTGPSQSITVPLALIKRRSCGPPPSGEKT